MQQFIAYRHLDGKLFVTRYSDEKLAEVRMSSLIEDYKIIAATSRQTAEHRARRELPKPAQRDCQNCEMALGCAETDHTICLKEKGESK